MSMNKLTGPDPPPQVSLNPHCPGQEDRMGGGGGGGLRRAEGRGNR